MDLGCTSGASVAHLKSPAGTVCTSEGAPNHLHDVSDGCRSRTLKEVTCRTLLDVDTSDITSIILAVLTGFYVLYTARLTTTLVTAPRQRGSRLSPARPRPPPP